MQLSSASWSRAAPLIDFDDQGLRRFHVRVALGSTGGVFADGFGLGIIGLALTLAAPQLGLDAIWMGLLGGASLAGLFAGALLTGPLADHYGRRPIFAYNMLLAAPLSVLQFFSASRTDLLLLRLLIGFLLGTDYVVSKALLTEFTPRRLRGRILGLLSIAWTGGYACAYAVGFALTDSGVNAWRWMLLTSAVPCLAIAPLRLTLPESPLWLASHGLASRAATIVREKFGADVVPPPATLSLDRAQGRWRQLFSRRWRTRTWVACAFFACQTIPYFAVGTFVSQIMTALHLQRGFLAGLVYNAALFAGACAGLLTVDRIRRRTFLIGSFCLTAAAMIPLCLWVNVPLGLMMALFAIFACVLSAASNLVYVYLPELFPTNLRASGIGVAIAASRIGSAIGTFLLPVVVADYGVRTALAACVAVLSLGAIVCLRWAPETRHVSVGALDLPQNSA